MHHPGCGLGMHKICASDERNATVERGASSGKESMERGRPGGGNGLGGGGTGGWEWQWERRDTLWQRWGGRGKEIPELEEQLVLWSLGTWDVKNLRSGEPAKTHLSNPTRRWPLVGHLL